MARNDYQACLHATRSGLEGSSRSGDIVCRGVAGRAASNIPMVMTHLLSKCQSRYPRSSNTRLLDHRFLLGFDLASFVFYRAKSAASVLALLLNRCRSKNAFRDDGGNGNYIAGPAVSWASRLLSLSGS